MTQEKILDSKPIFAGTILNLRVDTVQLPDGQTTEREIIQHNGATAVVALDAQGQVYLVRQYRSAAGRELLELPAGGIEPPETREQCARRELQEEIGQYPGALEKLGDFWVAASYSTELITIYLAQDLRPSDLPADRDESITVTRLPFDEAVRQALDHQIEDSKTVIGLVWAARRLGRL